MAAHIKAPREEVARLHAEGLLDQEIADRLEVSVYTIGRVRKELGLPSQTTARKIPAEELALYRERLEEGLSYADVARTYGVDVGTLRKRIPGFVWTMTQRIDYLRDLRTLASLDSVGYAFVEKASRRSPKFNNK